MPSYGLDLFRSCSLNKDCRPTDQVNMQLNTWLSHMLKDQHVLKLAHHLFLLLLSILNKCEKHTKGAVT